MSKILVIEPQKILQQAIVLSLFPEHDVRLSADFLEQATPGKDFDLVIIDAAALRQANALTEPLLGAVQDWKMPTIWIQDGGGPPVPRGGKFVALSRPIQKHALQSAVAECLATSPISTRNGPGKVSAERRPSSSTTRAEEVTNAPASDVSEPRVIELVDVVEEESEPKTSKTRQRKTR
jgi:hypothetical protein